VGWPFRREAHPEQRSLADDARRRRPANSGSPVMRPAGERQLELYDSLVNQFGEGREDGSSPRVLSTVAQVGRRGTTVVVRTRGRQRWLAGHRGSSRQWGPHGGETEGGRWPEMAAIDEALLVETAHGVGWLRGLFTAAGSR
jgi:hypothetical protein